MVIDKVTFHNWVGFYYGLHTDTFELDFTKRKHRMCLVFGTNGSGKTTLLEGLTLFTNIYSSVRDSNDFIITDKDGNRDGSRIIEFHNDTDTFVSKVYWINEKTKAYLFRTTGGIEEDLNPSGNVTTYNEQLELRFGLTKDLDRLLFLGPGMKDIISLTPSERKNQISKFTPSIEKYLELYKNSTKYYSKLKSDIAVVSSELHKLGDDRDKIISLRDASKAKYDKTLEDLQFLKHVESTTVKTIDMLSINGQSIIGIYDNKVDQYNEQCKDLNVCNEVYKERCAKYGISSNLHEQDYQNEFNKVHDELIKIQFNSENFRKHERELIDLKTNLTKTAETQRSYLNQYISENDPEKFKTEQTALHNELMETEVSIEELKKVPGLENPEDILFDLDDSTKYLVFVDNLMNRLTMIQDYYTEGQILEKWMSGNLSELNPEQLVYELKQSLSDKQKEYDLLRDKLAYSNTNKELYDLFKNIPPDCKNPNCPFVKRAKDLTDNTNMKDEIVKQLNSVNSEIVGINTKISDAESLGKRIFDFNHEIQNLGSFIDGYTELISKFPDFKVISNLKEVFKWTNFLLPRARKYSEFSHVMKHYSDILSRVQELSDMIQKTSNFDSEVQKMRVELDSTEKSVLKVENDLQQLYNENQSIAVQEATCQEKLSDLKIIIDDRRFLVEGLKHYDALKKDIKKLRRHYIASRFFTDRLSELRKKIQIVSSDLKQYEVDLNSAEYNLRRYDEFVIQRDKLNKEFELLDTLRKCWSPTTGIPLIFIEGFMNQLLQDSNKYLAEIFTDKNFLISGFKIDDKNFYILIDRGGDELNESSDASQCSGAERSMLTTVLSLALLKQIPHADQAFNITRFDEIDGTLDYEKRRVFTSILTDLLDEIKGEQTFFITHSDAIQDSADVILLSGSEEYEQRLLTGNYNVIYRY